MRRIDQVFATPSVQLPLVALTFVFAAALFAAALLDPSLVGGPVGAALGVFFLLNGLARLWLRRAYPSAD